jgi:hypothetical protein
MRLDFNEFERKIDLLHDVVVKLICVDAEFDLSRPIFYEVVNSSQISHAGTQLFREFFLNFAHELLKLNDGGQLKKDLTFREQCEENRDIDSDAIRETNYAEYLTATSLALYFLGEPFNQPWERVRQKVKSSIGGVPNGACVGKAIGDVVRFARLAGARAGPAPIKPLLMHSHMPLVLHESYVRAPDAAGCVPKSAHVLGHCYELLQMMLYANAKLPFRYFIPKLIFKAKLTKEGPSFEEAWNESLDWMCNRVFPGRFEEQFVVLTRTETFRPVFLNGSTGVLTSPRAPEGTEEYVPAPLPGTFLREARLELIRDTLEKIPVRSMINLHAVAAGFHTREKAFQALFP